MCGFNFGASGRRRADLHELVGRKVEMCTFRGGYTCQVHPGFGKVKGVRGFGSLGGFARQVLANDAKSLWGRIAAHALG